MYSSKVLVNRAFSTYKRDESFLSCNFLNLRRIYTDAGSKKFEQRGQRPERWEEEEHISSSKICDSSRIRDCYNFNSGYSLPTINVDILERIRRSNKASIPWINSEVTKEMVAASDRSSISRYCRGSKGVRKSVLRSFCRAGRRAALALCIISPQISKKAKRSSIEQCVLMTSKPTNAGFPTFKKKNTKMAIKDALKWLSSFLDRPTLYSIYRNPCVIFHRFQPKIDYKKKVLDVAIRQVWALPYRIISLEYFFFGNIIDRVKLNNIRSRDTIYSSGLTNSQISDKMVNRLRNYMNKSIDRELYSMDYSKYDSTIPEFFFDIFFAILAEEIKFNSENEKKAYDLLRFYLKFTPFLFEGNCFCQRRGMPSGSLITNLFDTWVNLTLWILAEEVAKAKEIRDFVLSNKDFMRMDEYTSELFERYFVFKDVEVRPIYDHVNICVCGDDTLILTNKEIIKIHNRICLSIGMKINVFLSIKDPKQYTFFLGRFWDMHSRPVNPDMYMTSHIIMRSKWYNKDEVPFEIDGKTIEFYRILSICGALYNGPDYIGRTFNDWKEFKKFLRNSKSFYDLRGNPEVEYKRRSMVSFLNWRLF